MNTCKTCRFWGNSWNGGEQTPDARDGRCNHEKVQHDTYPAADGVRLIDHWSSEMITGPDYGCVLWQQSQNLIIASITPGQNHVSLLAQEPKE